MEIKSLIGSLVMVCSFFVTSVLAENQSDSKLFNLATTLANTGNASAQYNSGMMITTVLEHLKIKLKRLICF